MKAFHVLYHKTNMEVFMPVVSDYTIVQAKRKIITSALELTFHAGGSYGGNENNSFGYLEIGLAAVTLSPPT